MIDYKQLFEQFPVLYSQRLTLRRVMVEDAADIFIMRSDPEVMRYIPRPLAHTIDDVYPLIGMLDDFLGKGERINWAITFKDSDTVLGMIGYVHIKPEHYRAEVGYSLSRAYHRQGIMREALLRVIDYGFDAMKLHTIEAIVDADNEASAALLSDVGFRQEAHFREDFLHNGSFRNSIHFGMMKGEQKVSK